MKKVLAVLLALAMMIPLCLIGTASAEEVKAQPFYTLGWSDFDEKNYPYLDGLVTANFTNIGDKAKLGYGGGVMQYGSYTDEDVTKVATALKKTMDARPEGARYLHLFGPAKIMKLAPKNALFMDHGVTQLLDLTDALLKKYKELGGQLDGMVIDTEYVGMGCYYLVDANTEHQTNNLTKNPKLLQQIVADPRYATEIRPMLEEWGFIFYQAADPSQQAAYTEIYSITKAAGAKYAQSRLVWDTVMRNHLNGYANKWCFAPLQKYFPEASLSDYQSIDSAAWMKMAAVTDDGVVMSGGNSIKVGNTSSYSYYYSRPSASFYKENQKYAGYNDVIFAAEPFSNLIYDINFTRHMYESSDTKQIAPWITYYTYGGQEPQSAAYTPYYSELLYHLGMFDPEPFLSYTYVGDKCFSDGRENSTHYKEIQQVKNEIMAELTRVAGYSDRKYIPMPINWSSKYVLSGMYANGRNIWRITPNTNVVSVADFKIEGADPTFRVGGQTVTFPGGKIIADSTISKVGTCGYWVETAKDVTPIVKNDVDRYQSNPAFNYNFEDQAEGKFDYNTSTPLNAWGFTWKKFGDVKGESNVIVVSGNKKLSITGTSLNWIKNLPNNVTAGDTFAEDQAWQLTVTIPEGMNAESEIIILNYEGNKQSAKDGGFKVAGGKLYYSEQGEYKELMDIAAGTYSFRREMNFNDEKAFYCTYTVLDASGKELKKVENIAVPTFNYITTLGFGVNKSSQAVVVDDFIIYLTGTTLDFSTYDAKTGQDVALNTTHDKSAAYRLAWLNATAKAETATLKADIYEGGALKETKVIKTVDMQPGSDGLETGIVEIAAGQSVKVYLESTVQKPGVTPGGSNQPSNPGTPGETVPGATEPGKKDEGGISTVVIALIAVVVLAVVGVVLALTLTKKKPAAKAEAKTEEKTEE